MFKDSEGREWIPRVTCGTIADFERESGVKLLEEVGQMLVKYQGDFTPGDEKGFIEKIGIGEILEIVFSKILGGTFDNLLLLAFVSIKDQAAERGVSFAEFKKGLGGDELKGLIPEVRSVYESFFRSIVGDLTTVPGKEK